MDHLRAILKNYEDTFGKLDDFEYTLELLEDDLNEWIQSIHTPRCLDNIQIKTEFSDIPVIN